MASFRKQTAKAEDVTGSDYDEFSVIDDDANDVGFPFDSSQRTKVFETLDLLRKKAETIQGLADHILEKVNADDAPGSTEASRENIRRILEQLTFKGSMNGNSGLDKGMKEHKFWATQIVPQVGDGPPQEDGFIVPSVPLRLEPYALPEDLEWTTVDIDDPNQIKEVYELLLLNYVEDDGGAFRSRYSPEFLSWALKPPGYQKEWHLGIRITSNNKFVAFISGVPLTLRVRSNRFLACEINFLCIHKTLRSKRLAPALIEEMTRRVALKGIFQAVYTSGTLIPIPVSVCRSYHHLINIPKLVEIEFCCAPSDVITSRMTRVGATSIPGLREMEQRDIPEVADLFRRYQGRFDLVPEYGVEEVKHHLLGGRGTGSVGDGGPGRRIGQVTWAYVVENAETRKVVDFFSFYSVPSTVIESTKHPTYEAAHLFYYGSETAFVEGTENDGQLKDRLATLIGNAIVIAQAAEFDVFSVLTLMDNVSVLQDLKFEAGNALLNYYLYNWRTMPLSGMKAQGDVPTGKGIGLLML